MWLPCTRTTRAPGRTLSRPIPLAPIASSFRHSVSPISSTDINVAGARLARRGAGERVYVAGAMGPLGLRIEPWGKTASDEAETYFREQAQALVEGGVDLLMLETFRDVNEITAAIAAVRSVCALPVVAQMTIEDEGNSLDGTPPEQFVPALLAGRRGCHRHQLQHRSRAHARSAGAHGRVHVRAPVRATQRGPAARHRRAYALPDLARIHGLVRQAIPRLSRPSRRRLLRDHTGSHQSDQGRRQRRRSDEDAESAVAPGDDRARGHADRSVGEVVPGQCAGVAGDGSRSWSWCRLAATSGTRASSGRADFASRALTRSSFLTARPDRVSAHCRWRC